MNAPRLHLFWIEVQLLKDLPDEGALIGFIKDDELMGKWKARSFSASNAGT